MGYEPEPRSSKVSQQCSYYPLSYLHLKSFITLVKVNSFKGSFYVQYRDSTDANINTG